MTKSPKHESSSEPVAGLPAKAMKQFQQRVVKAMAREYTKATKEKKILGWQRYFGPGLQLSVAMAAWLAITPDDRYELCQRYLKTLRLPEETKAKIREAMARAMKREPPEKTEP